MKIEAIRVRQPLRGLLGLVLALGGCGEGDPGPAIQPVTGTLLVDGKPAARARITFHPAGGTPTGTTPYAETDADGTFRPSTRLTGDGMPAGAYLLTVVWPEIQVDRGEEIAGRDRLGGRYKDPRTSKLKALIQEGENALPPIELKSTR